MVRLLSLFASWMSRDWANDTRRVDPFITIMPSGRARFDVAAYLMTEEGLAQLERFTR